MTLGLLLASSACTQASHSDHVTIELHGLTASAEEVRFLSGRAWATGDLNMHGVAVTELRSSDVVVAYIDTNRNGQLDTLVEPSTHCTRDGGRELKCILTSSRTVAHRIRNFRFEQAEVLGDDIVVTGAYFDADGQADEAATLCFESTSPEPNCAQLGLNPYVSGQGSLQLAFSPCQVREQIGDRVADDLRVVVSSAGGEIPRSLPMPPALGGVFKIRHQASRLTLVADVERPITQALAWMEDRGTNRIVWTSEIAGTAMQLEARHFEVEVPNELTSSCGSCRLVVQVAAIDDQATHGTYTEDRATLNLDQFSHQVQ